MAAAHLRPSIAQHVNADAQVCCIHIYSYVYTCMYVYMNVYMGGSIYVHMNI
jgi:hypothetical protein